MTVQLGDRARYKINGFTGIVTGRTSYLYQCDQVYLKPESLDKEGKPMDGHWYDEPWVEVVKAGVHKPAGTVEATVAGVRKRINGAPGRSHGAESRR